MVQEDLLFMIANYKELKKKFMVFRKNEFKIGKDDHKLVFDASVDKWHIPWSIHNILQKTLTPSKILTIPPYDVLYENSNA